VFLSVGVRKGFVRRRRYRASEQVDTDGDHTAAKLHGARMSADELVTNALPYCSTD
jgi:hypothetical protein